MRTIPLNKGFIMIPENWSELTRSQMKFALGKLAQLFNNEITPFEFQLAVLCKITGYRLKTDSRLKRHAAWLFFMFRRNAYWKYRRKRIQEKKNITFNLIRLAEQIDFAFSLEGLKITPKYLFTQNPLPKLFKHKPEFSVGLTVNTNITAKQFSECLDLVIAYRTVVDKQAKFSYLDKLIATLYKTSEKKVAMLDPIAKFGILCWFTSIVSFFKDHPVFGILFSREVDNDEDKIRLGLTETILYLKKEGYTDTAEIPIDEFFTAQVKALKDSLSKAIAAGATVDKLAAQTGLSMSIINRLT